MTTTISGGIPRQQHLGTATPTAPGDLLLLRPPTLSARQAPPYLVRAGYDLARRAIGYRLENVGFDDAVTRLLDEYPREEALRIASAYLAFSDLDAPRRVQVDALFLVENTLYRLEQERTRTGWRRFWPRPRVR